MTGSEVFRYVETRATNANVLEQLLVLDTASVPETWLMPGMRLFFPGTTYRALYAERVPARQPGKKVHPAGVRFLYTTLENGRKVFRAGAQSLATILTAKDFVVVVPPR